jgi:membrane protein
VGRARSLGQRFSEYLSVVLIGPLLVFSALGITASMMNASLVQEFAAVQPVGILIHYWAKLVPYLLVIGAFTFIYLFMPNTRVHFGAALTGGLVAGVLWQTTGWAFGAVVVGSTRYTAIYSSFAILIMFMIWLFVSWLILLFGASVAFYKQHPESLVPVRRDFRLSNRLREQVALLLMYRIGELFHAGKEAPTLEDLSVWVNIPADPTQRVLDALATQRLVVETAGDPAGYLPGLDLERLPLAELLRTVRVADEASQLSGRRLRAVPAVADVVEQLGLAIERSLAERTLRDLIEASAGQSPDARQEGAPSGPPAPVLPASPEPAINHAQGGRLDERGSA